MNVFLDTSVLLRRLFREPEPLVQWAGITRAFVSALLVVEVHRVVDRCRLNGQLDDDQVASFHEQLQQALRSCEIVALTPSLLRRAAQAMPTVLGALDAIHLASALHVSRRLKAELVVATHDRQLGRAARACALPVMGDA